MLELKTTSNNLLEFFALKANLIPTPLLDTSMGMLMSRNVMLAVKLNIFESLKHEPLTDRDVAVKCHTNLEATRHLLNILASLNYLKTVNSRYALTNISAKWLLKDSPHSLRDYIIFSLQKWHLLTEYYENFLVTGQVVKIHENFSVSEWHLYEKAMRSLVNLYGQEFARKINLPKGAKRMLDIGGGHGQLSVLLCKKYLDLTAKVLDLPAAVEAAAPILAQENMGNVVEHIKGDVLKFDLQENYWDVILTSQLLHHFDQATNLLICQKIAKALKPGGIFIIQEIVKPTKSKNLGAIDLSLDLFFAFISQSAIWTYQDLAKWQEKAGLRLLKSISYRSFPGLGAQIACKT